VFLLSERKKLSSHIRSCHIKKSIYCEVCGKEFLAQSSYQRHFQNNHTNVRPFKCTYPDCEFSCAQRSTLTRHLKDVHSSKKHSCSQCEKAFKTPVSLRQHVRAMHTEKNLICDFEGCGKAFSYYVDLKNHKNNHQNARKHICSICNESYLNVTSLTIHILTEFFICL
jgi:uncharacterized Zn-finger protein